ncbi:nuclear transport factor 2 family protein [Limobrevibacterium gyesilva]|uniref:Nuclear transport factor 2 family protein n=1 Tax=Limobrevibacterium gyesilva TaxID=2991712 RepID=A0AA42CI94_9PROT|nr:nuclear transport factor 2 family protein [Limobrevibacterium gyesilva]MCW3475655.1 nuclear transport factor 2 family protein [Limobrevibacterium gyesilva]
MSESSPRISVAALKQAIEGRDAEALLRLYADDAKMVIIDRQHPPSAPLEIDGRAAIGAYWHDVCGRAMTHRIEAGLADDTHLAFTESCAYPDGTRVFCSAMLDIAGGRITRQVTLQEWDG